ncbi:MAG TPA: hypothetical protein VMI92_07965 [Steroidobacteraceae bacterium]|nr:hypothetical protein [Steroidobacteraceae bacterium]
MGTGIAADLGGYRLFSTASLWNKDISTAAVDPNSATYIASLGTTTGMHADFGTQYGIPYVVVDGSTQKKVAVNLGAYADESDPGPFPIPANAPVENDGDSHVLVLDKANCWLYELYSAGINSDGSWSADSTALWDMEGNTARPYGWTSVDAAGLSVFEGLARHDEVARGLIDHALRFTARSTRKAYVLPATHWASSSTSASLMPMGTRLRLKASFDISGFSANNQVILKALKKYGMILADNGSNLYLSGANDPNWNDSELSALKKVTANDFEVVTLGTVYTSNPTGNAPTITSFTANPTAVASGAAVTLSFATGNASTLIVSPEQGPARGSPITVHPTKTTTYTLYASNAYGRTTKTVTVTVK